jgi:hypothetical protein
MKDKRKYLDDGEFWKWAGEDISINWNAMAAFTGEAATAGANARTTSGRKNPTNVLYGHFCP